MAKQKPTILLVEDERILAEMYRDKLSQAGFKTVLTFEAKKGLSLARKEKPDLIVLDILLPKENGIFFLEKLRQDPKIASTAVVVFSNYDDPETAKKAMELGAKAYLIKTNYTPRQLIEKIKKYVSRKTLKQKKKIKK